MSQAIWHLLTIAHPVLSGNNKIIVVLSADTNFVKASVIDYGIGKLTKTHLQKIFERFYMISGLRE